MIRFIAYKARLYPYYSNHCGGKATQEETMQTQTILKFTGAALFSLLISACGGGGDSSPLDQYTSSSTTSVTSSGAVSSGANTSNSSATSSIDSLTPAKIGSGSGDSFSEGVIDAGIDPATLSAGGSTALTVNIVSSSNTLVTSDVEVTFNSTCIASKESILTTEFGEEAKKVTTSNGQATIIYTAKGCVGPDKITASATFNGSTKNAETTITVEAGTVGSIKFTDANPTNISLS
jgi:hypothetical protein